MKGIILYYSGSGNTKLACQYISKNLNNIEIELFNMVKAEKIPDFTQYDFIGFAVFTDFGGPSYLVQDFIEKIPQQKEKLAFAFNTYGFISGKTLLMLSKWLKERGFNVVVGYSLHTPESYPPMIVRGRGAETNPDEKELADFKEFIADLNEIIDSYQKGKEIKKRKLKVGILGKTLPAFSRTKARDDMGEKFVDESLCDECGVCEKGCPYGAIQLDPKPKFDMEKCYGCWYCYNHCPEKAIYTNKVRGEGYYPKPNAHLSEKMKS